MRGKSKRHHRIPWSASISILRVIDGQEGEINGTYPANEYVPPEDIVSGSDLEDATVWNSRLKIYIILMVLKYPPRGGQKLKLKLARGRCRTIVVKGEMGQNFDVEETLFDKFVAENLEWFSRRAILYWATMIYSRTSHMQAPVILQHYLSRHVFRQCRSEA
ncbi:hypothetical protein MP228_006481 [Amoeboaphelidium protococcarum]|nr:hypothetical protein MP228_006481 [Amoeboaphelidium protococcarum]